MMALQKSEENKVIELRVLNGELSRRQTKLRKDGQPKQSGGNKKANLSCKVEPIRNQEELQQCRKYFADKIDMAIAGEKKLQAARNYAIFVTGINTSLRVSDILRIRWCDILNENDDFYKSFKPLEKKTHKFNLKFIKEDMVDAISRYYDVYVDTMSEYGKIDKEACIFGSRESGKSAMTEQNVIAILKKMGSDLKLPYNIGTHTMRKTYCYWYLMTNRHDSRALTVLMGRLNHSSPNMTLNYAGITDDESEQMDTEMSDFYKKVDIGEFADVSMTKMTKEQMIEFAQQMFFIGKNAKETAAIKEMIESAVNIYLENRR